MILRLQLQVPTQLIPTQQVPTQPTPQPIQQPTQQVPTQLQVVVPTPLQVIQNSVFLQIVRLVLSNKCLSVVVLNHVNMYRLCGARY